MELQQYRSHFFWILLAALLAISIYLVLPLLGMLLWALVLSILTAPIYGRLAERFKKVPFLAAREWHENAAATVVVLLTLLLLCVPFVLIGLGLFLQIGSFQRELAGGQLSIDDMMRQVDSALRPVATRLGAENFSIAEYVQEHREDIVASLRAPAGRFATQAGLTILTIVIALLTQFFMLRDGHRLRLPTRQLAPLSDEKTDEVLDKTIETVHAVFLGTVLVAILQGAIIGAAYAFLGVPNALLLGVISTVLCIVPFLGAPVIYIPVGLILLSQGDVGKAFILWGVGFGIVSNIDNLLKPWLIAGRVNLHPMAIFFSIIGGILMFGAIGIMAGPMLLTIVLLLVEVLRERLAPQEA